MGRLSDEGRQVLAMLLEPDRAHQLVVVDHLRCEGRSINWMRDRHRGVLYVTRGLHNELTAATRGIGRGDVS